MAPNSPLPLDRRGFGRGVASLTPMVWLMLALGASGFGPPTLGNGDPFGQVVGSTELAALAQAPAIPATTRSVAAIVVDAESGHPLALRNADARLAPASLTKMMTALVAKERASLVSPIIATERSRSEPSVIGLDPGDTLSLDDMLYGLLLPSGNDAALAIAESVGGGSIERFVGWMNERARMLGLKNTHFANPTGLDQEGHFSSARDLAVMAGALMHDPDLAKIAGTPRHVGQAQGQIPFLFLNSNPLLGNVPGVDGVKTGFTDEAGRCYAVSARRDNEWLIAVVLNSPNIGAEGQALLDFGFGAGRPALVNTRRDGFAAVQLQTALPGSGGSVLFAGWEAPFLRAYSGAGATTIALAGHALGGY